MKLNLDKEEFDLNTLFSFETLKIILLKLAKSQIKLTEEINEIKKTNLNRDKIIQKIGTSIGEDFGIQEDETNNDFDNEIYQIKDIEYKNDNLEEKEKEKQIDKEGENITNINSPKKLDSLVNNIENNSQNISKEINKTSNKDKDDNQKNIINQTEEGIFVSPDLFSKMMKQLKNQQTKLSFLEKKINSNSKNINNIDNNFKNHTISNESNFKSINEKINDLFEKTKDYEQKLENLQVKMSEIDLFSVFKDNGDGTIDATKIMVKALEEKIFKKFDLIDKRTKIDSLENAKTKLNVDNNILPKLEQFRREIERINENGNKNREDFEAYKKENEEKHDETKDNFTLNLKKKIKELKEEFGNLLNDKISLIENKINDLKNNNGDNFDILKLGLGNNDVKQETIEALEKKINDLRKKTNDIENTLKLYMNKNETDSIKNELKDVKLILDKKITKDDLKELYNYHLNIVDDINDLRDSESKTYDELKKSVKEIQNLQQKVESINGNLSILQKNPRVGGGSIIDFGRYIDQQKLNDTLRPILKEFEKVYKEIESVRRDISVNK